MEKRPDHELEQRRGRGRGVHRGYAPDEFFGLDVERMSPKAHIVAALAVLVPVDGSRANGPQAARVTAYQGRALHEVEQVETG